MTQRLADRDRAVALRAQVMASGPDTPPELVAFALLIQDSSAHVLKSHAEQNGITIREAFGQLVDGVALLRERRGPA